MNDPNRIVERVESLLSTARSAVEEAKTIFDGAVSDGEDEEVLSGAGTAFKRFCDAMAEAFEDDEDGPEPEYAPTEWFVSALSEPPPRVLIAMAHVLSEWFNDRAPYGEALYLEPALQVWRAVVSTSLTQTEPPEQSH